jgi:predicted DNA-binding WGR domain protein
MKISKTERVKIEQQEIEFKKWPGYRSSEIPELRRFVDMHNFYLAVAKNINTPPELLSRMVDGIKWIADNKVSHDVRMLVAINPSTPIYALEKLAKSKSRKVRRQTMDNPSLTIELKEYLKEDHLKELANDKVKDFRKSVANNPSKPEKSLRSSEPKEVKSIVNYYELIDDKSSKFWEIEQKGSAVHLRWGKIGTKCQSKVKYALTPFAAKNEVEKLIKQKTKKGYTKADPTKEGPTKEDKGKIKASIANLRKKLSRYKTYCTNNKVEITGEVKENIDSVDLLCKAAYDVSQEVFLYEKTEYDHEYLPNAVIHALDSANIAWKPITEICGHVDHVITSFHGTRDSDMIGCFPWTSESYPWPNKAAPGIQVDLRRMSQLCGENLGDGLLQVWFDAEGDIMDPTVIRVIPRDIVENESPDDKFVDFIPNESVEIAPNCWEEMNFPGWIITDYEMIGIQTDQGVELEEVSEEMHDLMEELHVNDTSFFGVPDPIQNLWSEFYEEGQRNLLSLSSEEYFCLGTDDTGQVMYKKKEDGKISFSFYWSHY